MTKHPRPYIAAVLALLLLAPLFPGASGATRPPTALSGEMPGGGFVVAKVDYLGGGPVELEISTLGCETGCAFGGSILGPDGSVLSSILVSWGPLGSEDCVVARSPDVGIALDDCHGSTAQGRFFGTLRSASGGPQKLAFWDRIDASEGDTLGVWTLIVWMAYQPDARSPTSWSLAFAPGVASVLGVETGDRAWYGSASEFQGGTALVASKAGAFVSAHSGARREVKVENRLFGMMITDAFGTATPAGGMTFWGPSGPKTCSCYFWNLTGPKMVGPGAYELTLDRLAAGHQGRTDVWIVLVDPRFPE